LRTCIYFSLIALFNLIPNVYGSNKDKITNLHNILSHINGKKYALVVGINKYTSIMPLEAAVNDAKEVSKRLAELNFQVTTLLDSQATLKNIRYELGTKFARTNQNDQIVIYFAGHGISEKLHNKKMEGYILPVGVNIKDLYSSAISMNELKDLTARIPARHILFIFDSCYSGLGLTRDINIVGVNETMQQHLESLAGQRAVYMITAGKSNEVAREFQGHGLFTLNFLDGIAGAADNQPKDGIVQASELGRYLAKKVSKDTRNEQNPQHGLIEGNGDFFFPLMDDDPVRLRESILSRLTVQSNEISKRQNIQNEFDKHMNQIIASEKTYRDEFDKTISALDEQIKQKQLEVEQLTKDMSNFSEHSITREQYNKMKFLNTGIEVDILKIFPDLKSAENYLTEAFGYVSNRPLNLAVYEQFIPLNIRKKLRSKNTYPTKIKSFTSTKSKDHWILNPRAKHLFSGCLYHDISSGYIDAIYIKTITPSLILSRLKRVNSTLNQDNSTYIKSLIYSIKDIDANDKLLLFSQFSDRIIARYGKPTKLGKSIYMDNWKTNKIPMYKEMIWEDEYVVLKLTGGRSTIIITITNKNPIINEIFKQAIKLCEAEQLILLKERIESMADLEREKTKKASKLDF